VGLFASVDSKLLEAARRERERLYVPSTSRPIRLCAAAVVDVTGNTTAVNNPRTAIRGEILLVVGIGRN